MKVKSFRCINTILITALAISSMPSLAQNPSRVPQAVANIEEYSGGLYQGLIKAARCARGDERCTPDEIRQTRIALGIVAASLATLAVGGAIARARGVWPFGAEAPAGTPEGGQPPAGEGSISGSAIPVQLQPPYGQPYPAQPPYQQQPAPFAQPSTKKQQQAKPLPVYVQTPVAQPPYQQAKPLSEKEQIQQKAQAYMQQWKEAIQEAESKGHQILWQEEEE